MFEVKKMEKLLSRKQLEATLGISRSQIYKQMRLGKFPEPITLSSKCVRWRAEEIREWVESRPRATGEHTPQVAR